MIRMGDWEPEIAIEFTAHPEFLVIVRHMVGCLAEHAGFSAEDAMQLVLCVDEACSNSIQAIQEKEGSRPKTKVRLVIQNQPTCICFSVHDSGSDFTHHFEKAVALPEGMECAKKRGYGLQIIKTFMDEVHYVHHPEAGNHLRLTKYLPTAQK